jgi:hypothetical protein
MACNQLNTGGTGIFDSDCIGKRKLTVIGVRLLWQKLGFDRNTDFPISKDALADVKAFLDKGFQGSAFLVGDI